MKHQSPVDPARTIEVEVALTAEEEAIFLARAKAASMGPEDFMRQEILRPLSKEELAYVASQEN